MLPKQWGKIKGWPFKKITGDMKYLPSWDSHCYSEFTRSNDSTYIYKEAAMLRAEDKRVTKW